MGLFPILKRSKFLYYKLGLNVVTTRDLRLFANNSPLEKFLNLRDVARILLSTMNYTGLS